MNELRTKTLVTSLTTFLFLVVGTTGILMFFHLLDDHTKVIHELLGLSFFLASIFHVVVNWQLMKRYFTKRLFITTGLLVFGLSILIVIASSGISDPQRDLVDNLVKAPIACSFVVLNTDFDQTKARIESNGIVIGDATTIEEIGLNNHMSTDELLELIIQ